MGTVLLAGDIGGTKTSLRLVDAEAAASGTKLLWTTRYEDTYPSQEYADLTPLVQQFLQMAAAQLGYTPRVAQACFGVAGPVVNDTSELTNLSWFLAAERLQRELAIPQVCLINDFVAIGYGILGLSPQDIVTLQAGEPDPNAPIAVVGAGTGLGECFVIPRSDGTHQVFASQGGHTDFAPRSPLEFQLLQYLQEKNRLDRVSVERVVSGMGIAAVYQFLRDHNPDAESPRLGPLYRAWLQETGQEDQSIDLSVEISNAALLDGDYLSVQTMKLFVAAYGAEAGNLALKLLSYGGLYIAGGIAAKILPLLQQGDFLNAFNNKGRMRSLMHQIPVHVVVNPAVGLIGATLRAAW